MTRSLDIWSLQLSSSLEEGLRAGDQGLLIAAVDALNRTATIVGNVPVAAAGNCENIADKLAQLIPQGLHVIGSYSSSNSTPWQPQSVDSLPSVAATNSTASSGPAWTINAQHVDVAIVQAGQQSSDVSLHNIPGFVPLRCHLDVQLTIQHTCSDTPDGANYSSANSPPLAAAIQTAMQQLQQGLLAQQLTFITELGSGSNQLAAPLLISSNSKGSSQTVQQALSGNSISSPCNSLLPLQSTSNNSRNGSTTTNSAPMFEFKPVQQQSQQITTIPLGLDVLCYVPATASLSEVAQFLLAPALQHQLDTMQQQLVQQAAARQPLSPIKAYHFLPPGLSFPVTICYSMLHASLETTELKLQPVRQELHQLLGLPAIVPMLRFANALTWDSAGDDESSGGTAGIPKAVRLRNVHNGLAPPGFGGQLYLVDGVYEYYHYMQDKFNDAGWGCAYRSLQTIVSWFRLQRYTNKPVPSHRQVQEILVALGDKEASFVGSSNWIGAIELSYILDEYLGVTSKVLTVNRGIDIPSQARALAQHFTTQGTPVMVGGGVLAYILLGVAFNEDTGEAAFLILDPHYTGGEDLKKIMQRTWVGWKQFDDNAAAGGPLFVRDAFYNFLCPQRPQTV